MRVSTNKLNLPAWESAGDDVALWWLGQAGFAVRFRDFFALIDPYLSDYLADKYNGKEFPHVRMMPPPVEANEIQGLDAVFCTHRHSDHLDPWTVKAITLKNPGALWIVPRAELDAAIKAGIAQDRLIPVNAFELVMPEANISITPIPSAHESLSANDKGEHHFLGYILKLGNVTLYHSGDCTPYDGLSDRLKNQRIDVALLPVNGRDEYRTSRGILGNFTFAEATALCVAAGIPVMIAHHFGMFDFNTVDPEELRKKAAMLDSGLEVIIPEPGLAYLASKSDL